MLTLGTELCNSLYRQHNQSEVALLIHLNVFHYPVSWIKNSIKSETISTNTLCFMTLNKIEIKCRLNRKMALLTSKLNIEPRKKFVRCYVWKMALYGTETWTIRKLEQKYLESLWNVMLEENGEDKMVRESYWRKCSWTYRR